MAKFQIDKDKKVLILTLLCFLGTGTGIGVFMGGQALLDLAAPPNRNFSTGGGLRASLSAFFMAMAGKDDKDSSANTPAAPSDPEKLAYLSDDTQNSSGAAAGLSGGTSAGGAGTAGHGSGGRSADAGPGKVSGELGELPSGSQSPSKMSSSDASKDLAVANGSSANGGASKNGDKKMLTMLKSVAGSAHDADLLNSASGARSGMGSAWGDNADAKKAYENGALSHMDAIKHSAIANLKGSDPKSLSVPDTGKLDIDSNATDKDPLNSQLNKALSGSSDASSGVANSLLSGVSSSLSSGVSSASSGSSGTTSATAGLATTLDPTLKANLDAWGVPQGSQTFQLYHNSNGTWAAVYSDGCAVGFKQDSKTGAYEAVTAIQGTHSCVPGTASIDGCVWQ
jgi:hypothetical protein